MTILIAFILLALMPMSLVEWIIGAFLPDNTKEVFLARSEHQVGVVF